MEIRRGLRPPKVFIVTYSIKQKWWDSVKLLDTAQDW